MIPDAFEELVQQITELIAKEQEAEEKDSGEGVDEPVDPV